MAIQLDAPFFLSTTLHRDQLRDGRPGAHVFIGSLTSTRGIANIAPHAAAKNALLGVIRTLAAGSASLPIWPARSCSCSPPRPATSPGSCCR